MTATVLRFPIEDREPETREPSGDAARPAEAAADTSLGNHSDVPGGVVAPQLSAPLASAGNEIASTNSREDEVASSGIGAAPRSSPTERPVLPETSGQRSGVASQGVTNQHAPSSRETVPEHIRTGDARLPDFMDKRVRVA